MESVQLGEFDTKLFNEGKEADYCLPITPETCTVLGYEVTAESNMWKGLGWRHVMIDECERWQYLHVDFAEPGQPAEDYERVRYRVRPLLSVGEEVQVNGSQKAEIVRIEVAGMWENKWWWRVNIKKKE